MAGVNQDQDGKDLHLCIKQIDVQKQGGKKSTRKQSGGKHSGILDPKLTQYLAKVGLTFDDIVVYNRNFID